MKNYVYLMVDEKGSPVAVYTSLDVAKKLQKPAEEQLETKIEIKRLLLNPDIKVVGL